MSSGFFNQLTVWMVVTAVLLALCTFLPIRIMDDRLRTLVMRWVLVPVSIIIITYVYPVGIEIFRRLGVGG